MWCTLLDVISYNNVSVSVHVCVSSVIVCVSRCVTLCNPVCVCEVNHQGSLSEKGQGGSQRG